MKYAFIYKNRDNYGVRKLCKTLGVAKSGYYDWIKRPESNRKKDDQRLVRKIHQIHIEAKENYGSIKVWKELKARGIQCGKHRVARIRNAYGIECKRRRRFKITTMSKGTRWIAPNLLKRCFKSNKPNEVWVGDVTFIRTLSGWLYLAVIIDLYSRKVVGWSMSNQNNKKLVLDALNMAIEQRAPKKRVLHHTDRGSIYGSEDYHNRLMEMNFIPSMSRKGDCWDNAVAESFFSTLKNELVYWKRFKSINHARSEIFRFIEVYYNRRRLHQYLNYMTPEMMEQNLSLN